MRHALIMPLVLPPILLCALAACDRGHGLYADRSIAIVAPAASAETAPRFVGRWAITAAQCADPWVIQAHSLKSASSNCDFDKIESSSAGYTANAVCHEPGGPTPVRLTFTTPNQAHISLLTVSGGPFRDAVPLQRCPAA
jgi:hypothetical protein